MWLIYNILYDIINTPSLLAVLYTVTPLRRTIHVYIYMCTMHNLKNNYF